jgi:hypothetical protein
MEQLNLIPDLGIVARCSHGVPENTYCLDCEAEEIMPSKAQGGFDMDCERAWEAYDSTCRATANEPREHDFYGATYEPEKDRHRLNSQLRKLWVFMLDGKWHTNTEMLHAVGGSGTGTTARYRDFRKARFGGHTVERRRVEGGLFEYRLIPNGELR